MKKLRRFLSQFEIGDFEEDNVLIFWRFCLRFNLSVAEIGIIVGALIAVAVQIYSINLWMTLASILLALLILGSSVGFLGAKLNQLERALKQRGRKATTIWAFRVLGILMVGLISFSTNALTTATIASLPS